MSVGRPKNTLERLKSLYIKILDNGCWEWTGARTKFGYGVTTWNGKYWRAHRLIYTLIKGPIPVGKELHHICVYEPCVNPDHQKPASPSLHKEFHSEMRTHCINGHELTKENSYEMPGHPTKITCRICRYNNVIKNRKEQEKEFEERKITSSSRI
jgi:hypothetical protein